MIATRLCALCRSPGARLLAACLSVMLVSWGAGCAPALRPPPPPTPEDSLLASTGFHATLQDHWAYVQEEWPELASEVGLRVSQLPPVLQDLPRLRRQFAVAALRALDHTNIQALTPEQYVSWLTLRWDMEALRQRAPFGDTDLSLIAPTRSPLATAAAILARHPLEREADAEYYLTLLEGLVPLADSIHAGLAARAERGVVLARGAIPRAVRFVRGLAAPPESSVLALPPERLAALDTAVQRRAATDVERTLRTRVAPALERLAAYLEGAYAERAPTTLGLGQYPGGMEHYRVLLKQATTLDITPEAAHAAGLEEVARLSARARQARSAAGLPVARDSLRAALQRHPAFRARDSLAWWFTHRADTLLALAAALVGELPVAGIHVDTLASADTALGRLARYTPPSVPLPLGVYRLHAAGWRRATLMSAAGRAFEDLVPGRHVQAARQRENTTLPLFRRLGYHAGFVDGWSAYALELSDSLLTRGSATEQFSARLRLLALACGLVVDTGINAFGWSAADALAFLREHLPDDDATLEAEFIAPALEDPASLVAATLGARELRGLRRWVERELGSRFALAAFHDEILTTGSVPLPVLGTHLEWWIWHVRTQGAADTARAPAAR